VNIVVCVKKVPEIDQVSVHDGKIISGNGMTNPFDMYAIEEGIRLKEKIGGEVRVISFGPEDSESALREALSLGADSAYRIWDDNANGSDIYASAKVLSEAIKKMGDVNMVLFGKQAVDNDASSIAGLVSGLLAWPQILFVKKIRELKDAKIVAERSTDDGYDVVEGDLPIVLSVVKEINEPRLPSLKGKMRAKKAPIELWSLSDLGVEQSIVGPESPSKLLEVMEPPPRPAGEIIQGDSPDEIAEMLISKLRQEKII